MKFLTIAALTLFAVSGNAAEHASGNSLTSLVSELEKQKLANQAEKFSSLKDKDRSQHGRILATYEYKIMENTGAALGKLDQISGSMGNVSYEIDGLTSALNSSQMEILDTLDQIHLSVNNGSSLVNTLQNISRSISEVFGSLSGNSTGGNGTLVGQFTALYGLLDTKLGNIEKILGYDDYPPSPFGTAGPGGRLRRTFGRRRQQEPSENL